MLQLVEAIREGVEPSASRALNSMVSHHLSEMVKGAVSKYRYKFIQLSIGEEDLIKAIITETVWRIAKSFRGCYKGEWINYCKISIHRALNFEYAKELNKYKKYGVLVISEANSTYGLPELKEIGEGHIEKLETTLLREFAFAKVQKKFLNRKGYTKLLQLIAWDPYVNNLREIARITGEPHVQNVMHKVTQLRKAYKHYFK